MDEKAFDTALIAAAFTLAGETGWRSVTVAGAARAAGLSLSEARVRFPSKAKILLRFGRMVDQAALEGAPDEGPVRDRLFDLLMRRFEALQAHRAGVISVMRAASMHPPTAVLLACATRRSMRWMLHGAGCTATGVRGEVRARVLVAIWLWTLRTWERDETADLSGTMATLDAALARAEQAASWLSRRRTPKAESEPPPSQDAGDMDEAD